MTLLSRFAQPQRRSEPFLQCQQAERGGGRDSPPRADEPNADAR